MSTTTEETPAPNNEGLNTALEDMLSPSANPSDETPEELDFLSTIASEIDAIPKEEEKPKATTPKKAEEKPTEAVETDDFPEDPPGKGSDLSRKGWKELKAVAAAAKADRDANAAKIKELEAKLASVTELEEKAKFADDAEKELALYKVESSREFQRTITKPLEAIGVAAEALAKRNDIEPEALYDAIIQPDAAKRTKALENILSGVGDHDKYEVYGMIRDTQTLLAKGDELREKASTALKEVEENEKKEKETQTKESRKKFESEIRRTADTLKERIPLEALADGETVDGIFENLVSKSLGSDFSAADPGVQAYSVYAGLLLPRLVKQLHAVQAAKQSAEARIAELTSKGPSEKPSTSKPSKAAATGDDFMSSVGAELGW